MRPSLVRTELEQMIDIFRALGEPLRFEIIRRMSAVEELACTELETELPVSKSTISYHMRLLYHAGLIDIRKDGRYYHYRLRRDVMHYFLLRFLDETSPTAALRQSAQRSPSTTTTPAQKAAARPAARRTSSSGPRSTARRNTTTT